MTTVSLRGLTKAYPGSPRPAVSGLDLEVRAGELVALLGPSGCGKTTTLKMIAGLLAPSSGEVLFDGEPVTGIRPEKRQAVMVFQNTLLFPTMTVADNIAFGLRMRRVNREEAAERVGEMAALMQLRGLESRRPAELSGGQKQRVALARALVVRPRVLLLDEPLSSLDAYLREEMRELILTTQRAAGVTTIFVTHDQQEAVLLADRVALMFDGQLQQFSEPRRFYERPATRRIALFFGCRNFLRGRKEGARVRTRVGEFRCRADGPAGEVLLMVRPEAVEIGGGENSFEAGVKRQTYLGTHTRYRIDVDGRDWEVLGPPSEAGLEGRRLRFRLPAGRIWLLQEPR